MIKSVEEYLNQLRKELAGCDPATIQDALSDSEEHLNMALGSESDIESVIEKYGSPEEVAAGYKELEDRVSPPLAPRPPQYNDERHFFSRFFGVFTDTRAWAALVYFILTLGTGIAYFTWVVTGLSVSAGLLILIIGLPVLVLFLLSVRGIAFIEGRLIEALLGVRMPRRSRYAGAKNGFWERIGSLFTDRTTWTSILYMLFLMPFGIFYFVSFISLIGFSLELITVPVAEIIFDHPVIDINDHEFHTPVWLMPLVMGFGVVLLTLTMHLIKLVGYAHGRVAKALLVAD